mgnify:FL=1
MYKLLALDLDDTLLNDKGEISEVNRKAILKAQKKGIKIVLASGRPTGAMTRFIEELELDKNGGYIVSFNGGEIINCETRESVFKKALTIKEIHKAYDASKKHNCSIITYRGDNIVSETMDEYIGVEVELTKMPLIQENSFKEAVDFEGVKCIVLQEPSYLKKVEKLMKDEFSDLSISISKPFFLEITAKGIDKGHTIGKLAESLNICQDEVIACGNAENDLSMIKYAGLGVWVANTASELHKYGQDVVASNEEDGVAELIEKYLL